MIQRREGDLELSQVFSSIFLGLKLAYGVV